MIGMKRKASVAITSQAKVAKAAAATPWYTKFTRGEPNYDNYMENEWGHRVHDDRMLFEYLTLEGAQAGLSWSTILAKREGYRSAFANFDVLKLSKFTSMQEQKLLTNQGIVRHAGKIKSVANNARCVIKVQEEHGSLCKYLWSFVGGDTMPTKRKTAADIPTKTEESIKMSKDLKAKGFKFVGPTICYAFMQATGMVNDHPVDSPQWLKLTTTSLAMAERQSIPASTTRTSSKRNLGQ